MASILDRTASRFWHRLAIGFNWAGWFTSKASSFCVYREVHILAEAGELPERGDVHVPDASRRALCSGRACPDGRHCIHYYTAYPASCCDCQRKGLDQ